VVAAEVRSFRICSISLIAASTWPRNSEHDLSAKDLCLGNDGSIGDEHRLTYEPQIFR